MNKRPGKVPHRQAGPRPQSSSILTGKPIGNQEKVDHKAAFPELAECDCDRWLIADLDTPSNPS